MTPVFTICRKEFEDHLRNGWIVAIALAFGLFAFVIGIAGFGFTGKVGGVDSEATIVSLTSLVLYLIPLLGLLLGYDGIAGEHEQGTLDLLRAYPIQPTELMVGKWMGLGAVLAAILAAGLALPAILAMANGHALMPWLAFASLSVWLGLVFIALALWLSTLATQRGTVYW
jgi:Cu-processing system permease protein